MTTFILTIIMMAGLFLLLWGAVGFVQNKKLFSSAPKEIVAIIQSKTERFSGQHIVGWCMMISGLLLIIGAVVFDAWDGVHNDFAFWQLFVRFFIMVFGTKALDIIVFDWFLLCHSNFYPHYYPKVKDIVGSQLFGYNWKSHLTEISIYVAVSVILSLICTFAF